MVKKGYKQTEIGVIPEKWKDKKLGDVGKVCMCNVILHELAHLKVHNHGPEFTAILDQYMPYWREHKRRLNDSTLDYLPSQLE